MPTISLKPLSGRYLSFAEREEIAILRAQDVGIRSIAGRLKGAGGATPSRYPPERVGDDCPYDNPRVVAQPLMALDLEPVYSCFLSPHPESCHGGAQ